MNHDDDLTASHWDDVFTPSNNYGSSSFAAPDYNGFSDLNINKQPESDNDEDENEIDDKNDDQHSSENNDQLEEQDTYEANSYNPTVSAYDAAKSEMDQMYELRKEAKNEQKSQLMNELTKDDNFDLENSIVSPKIEPQDSLFLDNGSPIKSEKIDTNDKKKGKKFKRPRKFSSQRNIQHLSNVGPLGLNKLTDNLSIKSNNAKDDLLKESEAPLYDIKPEAEETSTTKVELPKLPSEKLINNLDISVSDPMKVGDITNAHIIYTITTKPKQANDKFPNEVSITRRYKDFRWIYHQLQSNHLGRIIPPPPLKQTYIGRFNESFIENRRLSLEKMLNKIASIDYLSSDEDFIMFLTSEDFANEAKERERISGSGASTQNNDSLDNDKFLDTTVDTSSSNGFMSSIFSMSTKIDEPDEYFENKRHYIETLETNLKNFYKSIELIINQRVDIVNIMEQIIITIEELSDLEISKKTSNLLAAFNDIQIKLKENLDRINLQHHLTLGFTIEEYLRIIGSIKYIFDQRLKIYQTYQNYLLDLNKKKSSLSKYKLRNAVDKIETLNFEIDKLSTRTSNFENKFNLISETIKHELETFEFEKIDDFRNSVEIFIESSIESQKESIELWETFYERQELSKY